MAWTRATMRLGRADFYPLSAELWLALSNFSKCLRAFRMLIKVAADAEEKQLLKHQLTAIKKFSSITKPNNKSSQYSDENFNDSFNDIHND